MWREFYVLIIIHITLFFIYSFELNWVPIYFYFIFDIGQKNLLIEAMQKKIHWKNLAKTIGLICELSIYSVFNVFVRK